MALTKEDRVERLATSLRLLAHRSIHAARVMGASVGANATDFDALAVLIANRRPMLVNAFARELALTSAAVTAVLDRMVAAGFIRRVRDEVDRRRVYVELTDQGREVATAALAPLAERLHEVLAGCTVDELYGAQKVLNLAMDAMERSTESQPSST